MTEKPRRKSCDVGLRVKILGCVLNQRSAKGKRNPKISNLVENPNFPQCPPPKVPVQTLVPWSWAFTQGIAVALWCLIEHVTFGGEWNVEVAKLISGDTLKFMQDAVLKFHSYSIRMVWLGYCLEEPKGHPPKGHREEIKFK